MKYNKSLKVRPEFHKINQKSGAFHLLSLSMLAFLMNLTKALGLSVNSSFHLLSQKLHWVICSNVSSSSLHSLLGHMLDSAVGKSNRVGALDIAGTIGGLLSIEVGLGEVHPGHDLISSKSVFVSCSKVVRISLVMGANPSLLIAAFAEGLIPLILLDTWTL